MTPHPKPIRLAPQDALLAITRPLSAEVAAELARLRAAWPEGTK